MLKNKIIILCAAACLMSNASVVSCTTGPSFTVEQLSNVLLTVEHLSNVLRIAFAQNLLKIDFQDVFKEIKDTVKIDDHTTMTKKEICAIAQQINSSINGHKFDLTPSQRAECITQAVVMIAKLRAIEEDCGAIKDKGDHYELYVDDVMPKSDDMTDDELLNEVFNLQDEGLKKLIGVITSSGNRKLSPIFRNRLKQLKSYNVKIGESMPYDVWGVVPGLLCIPNLDVKFDGYERWALSEYVEYALSHELGHFAHGLHAGISSVVNANKNCLLLAVKSLSKVNCVSKESICNDKLFDLNTFGKMWGDGDEVLNILGAVVGFYAKKGSTDVKPIIIYDSNCENAWRFFHHKPLHLTHQSTCITENGMKREQYDKTSEAIPPQNLLVDDLCDSDKSLESLDCANSIYTELKERYEQMTGLKSGDDVAH